MVSRNNWEAVVVEQRERYKYSSWKVILEGSVQDMFSAVVLGCDS